MSVFMLSRDLEPTKTWGVRWYHAVFPAGDFLARVLVVQRKKEGSLQREEDTYFLDWIPQSELPSENFTGFQFHNISKEPTSNRPGHYRVILNAVTLEILSCNCKGATCYRQTVAPCKHRDVIRSLLAENVFHAKDLAELEAIGTLY